MTSGSKSANAHALERLVFFSDAVFAIAITLLVIELHAPKLPHGVADMAHWNALWEMLPHFFGFALSFYVIGRFWVGHHRAFSLARKYDETLLMPNLMLLMAIAFIPFVTAYLAANLGERVPTFCYNLLFLVTALLSRRVGLLATKPPICDENDLGEEAHLLRDRGLAVVFAAASAIIASLITPIFGQIAIASMVIWKRLITARRKKRAAV